MIHEEASKVQSGIQACTVKKLVEQGLSCREVARSLGVADTMIHNWRKAFEADGSLPFQSQGDASSVEAELKRLREENRQLKMERDILPLEMSIPRSHLLAGLPL